MTPEPGGRPGQTRAPTAGAAGGLRVLVVNGMGSFDLNGPSDYRAGRCFRGHDRSTPDYSGVVASLAPPPLSSAPTSQDSGCQIAQFIRSPDRPVGDPAGFTHRIAFLEMGIRQEDSIAGQMDDWKIPIR